MASTPREPRRDVASLARGIGRFDPAAIGLRAAKAEFLLNARITPFFGLHGAVIGALVFAVEDRNAYVYYGFGFFALAAVALLATLLPRIKSLREPTPLPLAAAACFSLAGIFSFPPGQTPLLALAALYGALFFLLFLRRTSPYEVAVACLYLPLFASIFWEDMNILRYVVFAAVFVPAFALVWTRFGIGHTVLLFIGSIAFLAVEVEEIVDEQVIIVALTLLFVAAFMIYEIKASTTRQSAMRHFLSQGLIASILLLLVFVIEPKGDLPVFLWVWAALLSGYHLAVGALSRGSGVPIRLAWVFLAINSALWTGTDIDHPPDQDFWWAAPASLASLLALYVATRRLESAFGLNFCRLLALAVLAAFLGQAWTVRDHVLNAANAANPAPDGVLLTDAMATMSGLVLALLAAYVIISLIATRVEIPRGNPFWRGLFLPRHAALARRFIRASVQQIQITPFINSLAAGTRAILRSWRYFKGTNEAFTVSDLTLLGVNVFAAVTSFLLLEAAIHLMGVAPELQDLNLPPNAMAFLAAWSIWGLILFVRGTLGGAVLFRFLATVFVLVPLVRYLIEGGLPEGTELALLLLIVGLPLLLFGLLREAKPFRSADQSTTPAPPSERPQG